MLEINSKINIPMVEIQFTFAKSSGPGGQKVNKSNTQATLRWNVRKSNAFKGDVRKHILLKLRTKITRTGDIVIQSDRYRDQESNKEDCLEKLKIILTAAAQVQRRRKATKATKASKEKRLDRKKQDSEKKRTRQKVRY